VIPDAKTQYAKVLLVALPLTLAAIAWITWTIRHHDNAFKESMAAASKLRELSEQLAELDEALLISASFASHTDDPMWRQSFELAKQRLDQVLDDVQVIDSETYAKETALLLLAANMHVVRSEYSALTDSVPAAPPNVLLRVGGREDAFLAQTVAERIRELTDRQVETSRRQFTTAASLSIAAALALFAAWIVLLAAVQRQVMHRHSVQRVLDERERLEQLRTRFLEQFVASQEEQSRQLAQELHDGIGQCLTFLLVGLRTLEDIAVPEERLLHSRKLRALTSDTIVELGRLAKGLHPSLLEDLGVVDAVHRLRDDFVMTHRLRADLQVLGFSEGTRLPRAVEAALYRITQEALNNIAKHAAATTVSIILENHPEWVRLIIEDDGRGYDPAAAATSRPGLGLQSSRERIGLLKGTFAVESSPGKGTTVYATIPRGADLDATR
jgi:signal transduction histidine kinase